MGPELSELQQQAGRTGEEIFRVLADVGVSICASGSRLENNRGSNLKSRTGSGVRSGSTRKGTLPISAWVIPAFAVKL